jgi:hypothetical protein
MSGTTPEIEAAARADAKAVTDDVPPASGRRGRPKGATTKSTPAGAPRPDKAPGRPPASKTKLAPKLEELFSAGAAVGLMYAMARSDERLAYDAQRALEGAERLALALDKAAQESPALRRALDMLVTTSAWGELGMALGSIVLPILANHGMLPEAAATLVGAPAPPPRPVREDPAPAAGGNGAPPGQWKPLDLSGMVPPEAPA